MSRELGAVLLLTAVPGTGELEAVLSLAGGTDRLSELDMSRELGAVLLLAGDSGEPPTAAAARGSLTSTEMASATTAINGDGQDCFVRSAMSAESTNLEKKR